MSDEDPNGIEEINNLVADYKRLKVENERLKGQLDEILNHGA